MSKIEMGYTFGQALLWTSNDGQEFWTLAPLQCGE